MVKRDNSILYGLLAGLALLIFYISVISIFQGIEFAFLNLRSLWYLIFPLAAGFGTQIGLYFSIKHSAQLNAAVAGTGTMSGGSMVACCSHFLLNIAPLAGIAGLSGLSASIMAYQKWILLFGIFSSVIGIIFLVNHKRKMKGGTC